MHGEAILTVLLVDDNSQISSFIRTALENCRFNCIEAGEGQLRQTTSRLSGRGLT